MPLLYDTPYEMVRADMNMTLKPQVGEAKGLPSATICFGYDLIRALFLGDKTLEQLSINPEELYEDEETLDQYTCTEILEMDMAKAIAAKKQVFGNELTCQEADSVATAVAYEAGQKYYDFEAGL